MSQVMAAGNEVEDYTPRYSNPAINFATDDMGSDLSLIHILITGWRSISCLLNAHP